jgi:hypothetical protein
MSVNVREASEAELLLLVQAGMWPMADRQMKREAAFAGEILRRRSEVRALRSLLRARDGATAWAECSGCGAYNRAGQECECSAVTS